MDQTFLRGSVVDIDLEFRGRFTIQQKNYYYTCHCQDEYFIPILGAEVSGEVEKNGWNYLFMETPEHQIPPYTPEIKMVDLKSLLKTYVNKNLTRTIMDYFTIHPIFATLTNLSQYEKDLRRLLNDEDYKTLGNLVQTEIKTITLLGYGFPMKKIKKMTEDKIHKCLSSPLKCWVLRMDQALSLCDYQDVSYSPLDCMCGNYGRVVYKRLKDKLWTYSPIYPLPPELIEHLEKYDLKVKDDRIFFQEIRDNERSLSNMFKSLMMNGKDHYWDQVVIKDEKLTLEQKESVKIALQEPISIITGAAGTGKSLSIAALAKKLKNEEIKFACSSFTGKAVSRLKQFLLDDFQGNPPCYTLHRLLLSGLLRSQYGEIEYLILDESGMITGDLLGKVLKIYKSITHIVLVGDVNQLDPFGKWGRPFLDLWRSQKCPITTLTKNFRQTNIDGQPNGIVVNAGRILDNRRFLPASNFIYEQGNISYVVSLMSHLHNEGIEIKDMKVLCPYRDDVEKINLEGQKIWAQGKGEKDKISFFSKEFYLGDPVMMTVNCPAMGIMNGDVGIVSDIKKNSLVVTFSSCNEIVEFYTNEEIFDKIYDFLRSISRGAPEHFKSLREEIEKFFPNNEELHYELDKIEKKIMSPNKDTAKKAIESLKRMVDDITNGKFIKNLVLAYAMTIHKSQGSEYSHVIYYLSRNKKRPPEWLQFVTRNMTYTAITRSKFKINLIDTDQEIEKSISILPPERKDSLYRYLVSEQEIDKSISQKGFSQA